MKKLLYTLSIVLAGSLAANAAPATSIKRMVSSDLNAQTMQTVNMASVKAVPTSSKKNVKRNVGTAQDYLGVYQWSGRTALVNEDGTPAPGFGTEGIMTVSQSETYADSLIITGFPNVILDEAGTQLQLSAYVKDGRMYIPNQYLFTNTYYNVDVWFTNMTLVNNVEEEGYDFIFTSNEYYFEMNEDGMLVAGQDPDSEKFQNHEYTDAQLEEMICFAAATMPTGPQGYFWLLMWAEAYPFDTFKFVSDEWKDAGTALFKDAWFPIFWQDGNTPSYEVPVMRNKADDNLFLLYNPYGPNTPYGEYEINIGTEPGFIVFNISEPDCVVFQPLVYSMTNDEREEGETEAYPVPYYNYNFEGYYHYLQGADYDELIVYMDQEGMDCSYIDENDPQGPVVYIYNALFSISAYGYTVLDPLYWGGDMAAMDNGYILLPQGYDAVKAIGEDNDAAPVYYNLQGVRVNNPEKGQLLIVKQGNKASKQVVR